MNRYKPHIYVIPEDDSNRQIADGFVLNHHVNDTQIQVVPPPGGWPKVLDTFLKEYVPKLRDYPHIHVLMLIDFDDQVEQRKAKFVQAVPEDFKGCDLSPALFGRRYPSSVGMRAREYFLTIFVLKT